MKTASTKPMSACERMNPPRRSQAAGADLGEVVPGRRPRRATHPGQELRAVLDEQEREHQREHRVDDAVGHGGEAGEDTGGDLARTLLEALDGRLHVPADLAGAEVERRSLQPALDLLDAADGALRDLRRLTGHGRRDQRHDPAERGQPQDQHQRRRQRAGDPAAPQPRDRGLDDRRDHEPEEHREHDVPQLDQDESDDRQRGDDDEEAQAPAGGPGESLADQVPTGRVVPPCEVPGGGGLVHGAESVSDRSPSGGRVRACAGARRARTLPPTVGRGSGRTRAPLPRWERGPGGSRSAASPSPSSPSPSGGPRRSRRGSPGC